MRILILWADDRSPNLGVRALGAGTEALARRVWPEAEFVFHNYGAKAAPVRIGALSAIVREAVTRRGGLSRWFRGFDLVLDTRAGDSFSDIYGMPRHSAMSATAEYAHRAGVPVVFSPQTLGPFDTRAGAVLARRNLRTAALVLARDGASAAYAESLGRPADLVTTDVVFALSQPTTSQQRDIVLNVSGLLWRPNPHVDSASYVREVVAIHHDLVSAGRQVSLLAHVLPSAGADNDVPALEEFRQRHAPDAEVLVPGTLEEVRAILAGASVVIGSRMHACLNGLSVGTPAIALAYSRKFAPLLADLGWPHVVDLRSASGSAVQQVHDLVSDPGLRSEVRKVQLQASAKLDQAAHLLSTVDVSSRQAR